MSKTNENWLERNTFHHGAFWDLLKLVEEKEKKGLKISLCIPTLNEEKTIGKEVLILRSELMERYPLVDEFAVIDSGSEDKTLEVASNYGADVYLYHDQFKTPLRADVAKDLRVIVAFVEGCKGAGATAAGFGNTYMGDTGIHVDIAQKGQAAGAITNIKPGNCWGGRDPNRKYAPSFALSPQCLKDIWAA